MLARELPSSQKELDVVPQHIPVVLAEGGGRALALILPPLEDMAEIRSLRSRLYSLREHVQIQNLQERFRSELTELKRKEGRFAGSPTYFNRVANLAFLVGDFDEEGRNLERARELSPDVFFVHGFAESLISRERNKDAETLFRSLDLERDLHANLRLAFFHVQRNEFERAESRIDQALRIDPLDFAARLFEGGLLLARGQCQRAIQSFRVAEETRQTATLYTNTALAFVRLGLVEKALTALKKAVALDPLHINANGLLADLAFRENKNEEALPSLRYFVQFEQKNAGIWSRLARACFHVGMIDETVAALKRQASLGENSVIWNNLGVCYQRQHNQKKALEAFKQAVTLDKAVRGRDYFLAARNLVQALVNGDSVDRDALSVTSSLIKEDKDGICRKDNILSDIYAFHVALLIKLGDLEDARIELEELLAAPDTAMRLKAWLVNNLITYYTLYGHGERSLQLVKEYEGMFENVGEVQDPVRRAIFFNNAAFAFAEVGDVVTAERYLSKISNQIHRWPYPTATLGLIHFRKGHAERATELYREAVGLSQSQFEKERIRQKLYLERGRYLLQQNRTREAQRSLERVLEASVGELALADAAKDLLQKIPSDDQTEA
jgi:tetratricopeptide (TPR) repeat protein